LVSANTGGEPPFGSLRAFMTAHEEKIRYLLVGAWNTAFGYGLFLLLLVTVGPVLRSLAGSAVPAVSTMGEAYYVLVGWLGWIIAVPQSTLAMRSFVFRRKGHALPQIGRAYFVYLPAQGLSSVVLWVAVSVLHMIPSLGALSAIVVTTVFSYLGHKYFTFRVPLEVGEVPDERLIEGVTADEGMDDRDGV
jgi:putative flippase GtrA